MNTVPNPAPKPFATTILHTDSGDLVVPCEPINEWLAIIPCLGMDKDGNSVLEGAFSLTHTPTGTELGEGPGCIQCCRNAAAEIVALGLDLSALTKDNGAEWSPALPDETRAAFMTAREISWICDAEDCPPSDLVKGGAS